MIQVDEHALICDFAETYQIYDYKQLPLNTVAVLACGLRENSRIKMILSNQEVSTDIFLLASIVDRMSMLLWTKTEDGQKNRNRPKMLVDMMISKPQKETKEVLFHSGEDFERERKKLLAGGE